MDFTYCKFCTQKYVDCMSCILTKGLTEDEKQEQTRRRNGQDHKRRLLQQRGQGTIQS